MTPWTVAYQASFSSIRFSKARIMKWDAISPPGELPDPGIKSLSLNISCTSRQVFYHECQLRSPKLARWGLNFFLFFFIFHFILLLNFTILYWFCQTSSVSLSTRVKRDSPLCQADNAKGYLVFPLEYCSSDIMCIKLPIFENADCDSIGLGWYWDPAYLGS